jgi:hypothetical protein
MPEPTVAWIHDVAVDAYVYLYPLVSMELTRQQMTNTERASGSHAPTNQFAHLRAFPAGDFREVVRPNFDTLYSSAWLDLRDEPIVVSAGEDTDGRYYELPMYDMWTDAFAVPGQRTSGTGPGAWAVTGPGWQGNLPDGVARIDAPTPGVWIIGRTQTNGPADYPAVHAFQDTLTLTPLSAWGSTAPEVLGSVDPGVDMATPPLQQANSMDAATYFDLGLRLLAEQGPHLTDGPLLMRMERAGLGAGATFGDLPTSTQEALSDVPSAALASMTAMLPRLANVVNGWQMNIDTMGVYGNFYVKRAIVAMVGLGANAAEDAVYPLAMADADGDAFDGATDYVLRFAADELPPVDAFWSLTMYDGEGFQIPNALDRFAIGDRDALQFGPDCSLELYLQHSSPGAERESNWLPSAPGPLGLTLRLYAPQRPVLDGTWNPPPVHKA